MGLTLEEKNAALLQGWMLCDIYDLKTKALILEIMPAGDKRLSRQQAFSFVTKQAGSGDALAIKALTLISRRNFQKK